MVTHPHIYKRLQVEMDEHIGTDRLPDFDDRASLPFLNATIKETLRSVSSSDFVFTSFLSAKFLSLDGMLLCRSVS